MSKQGVYIKVVGDDANAENAVGGGKVWNPAPVEMEPVPKIQLYLPIIALIIGLVTVCITTFTQFIFVTGNEVTPTSLSMEDLGWFRWDETILLLTIIICFGYANFALMENAVNPIMVTLFMVVSFFLIVIPILAVLTKDNIDESNAWAEQYGYEFSYFHSPSEFFDPHQVEATNLETGEKETLVLKEVDGSITWEGMQKVSNENIVDIPTANVSIGKENIVDSGTGVEYTVGSNNGKLELIPVE